MSSTSISGSLTARPSHAAPRRASSARRHACLLYTSDAADERSSVDLGGRRIIKKKKVVDVLDKHLYTEQHDN